MSDQGWVLLSFGGGAVLSVLLPFLRNWVEEKAPFNWRQLVGQLLAAAIAILGQITGLAESLAGVGAVQAVAIGWGVSSMGRLAQKTYDLARARL